MAEIVQIGSPPIDVHLRRSRRARRFSLRISNTKGTVSLTLPQRASRRAAISFASDNEVWLRNNLARQPARVVPRFGGTILLDGEPVLLCRGHSRKPEMTGQGLALPEPEAALGARLRGYLKTLARERMTGFSETYAGQIGHEFSRISIRDTRSRWGSCTSDGNLMYSWRLVMAPLRVQEYVAAHEVCHLVEMNHSPAYWRLVETIFPDYRLHRNWLKQNGGQLHRVDFDG